MHGQETQRDGLVGADGTNRDDESGDGGQRDRSVTLATERELHAPLHALRLLLEGRRGADGRLTERAFVDREFIDRALSELVRAERAAHSLVEWTCPRAIRPVQCTIAEIVGSLSSTLDGAERDRCHFVVDDGPVELETDARLLVDAFARLTRELLHSCENGASEVMVHAHADDGTATISLVEGTAKVDPALELGEEESAPTLAEALLRRDVGRLGGRVGIHRAGEHRCCVAVLRRDAHGVEPGFEYGGAA
ncbi:MAG: hypothetical protein AAGB93_16095 [Planctomycetota bacterium]